MDIDLIKARLTKFYEEHKLKIIGVAAFFAGIAFCATGV